jgi:hypothetical protein
VARRHRLGACDLLRRTGARARGCERPRGPAAVRKTWGESITGAVVVGSAFGIAGVVALAVAGTGVAPAIAGFAPGYILAAVGAAAFAVTATLQTAVSQVFRVAVYRYATGSGATGPFAASDLEGAFRPRARRFWR